MTDAFTQGMLLQCQCDLAALQTEVEAMKSANKDREMNGYSMAYGDAAFQQKADEMRGIGNQARELGQRGS